MRVYIQIRTLKSIPVSEDAATPETMSNATVTLRYVYRHQIGQKRQQGVPGVVPQDPKEQEHAMPGSLKTGEAVTIKTKSCLWKSRSSGSICCRGMSSRESSVLE